MCVSRELLSNLCRGICQVVWCFVPLTSFDVFRNSFMTRKSLLSNIHGPFLELELYLSISLLRDISLILHPLPLLFYCRKSNDRLEIRQLRVCQPFSTFTEKRDPISFCVELFLAISEWRRSFCVCNWI